MRSRFWSGRSRSSRSSGTPSACAGRSFYFDITEINYPYRAFFAEELKAGRFSRWCPGLYCGLPLYSESQAGYLHPFKYLFYPWMATWKAFNLDTVLSIWLTGAGELSLAAAARRADGGALRCGHLRPERLHVGALRAHQHDQRAGERAVRDLGAGVLVVDGAVARRGAGAVCAGVSGVRGPPSGRAPHGGAGRRSTDFIARPPRRAWRGASRAWAWPSALVGLGILLSAVQWVPSKELLDRSPRAGGLAWEDLTYGSWHPELLPTMVVREAYGTRARDTDWMNGFYPYHEMNTYLGLIAIVLAVVGAGESRRSDRWVTFWVLLLGLAVVLMLGKFTFLFDYAHRIPIAGQLARAGAVSSLGGAGGRGARGRRGRATGPKRGGVASIGTGRGRLAARAFDPDPLLLCTPRCGSS